MEARTRHTWAVGLGLSAAGMRKTFFYRPLAALMALLMIPVVSLANVTGSEAPRTSEAIEQIGGCVADPSSPSIIRQYCVNGTAYSGDLIQLESDAVKAYLAFHNLPQTDSNVVYDLGRSDLRNEIRAFMMEILEGIIKKEPKTRISPHETNLYNWLQALVQQNEIALYTNAVNQYQAWGNNPCGFTLDAAIASANGLSYDGAPFCASPLNSLFGGPPVPAESYFTAYGMRKSYGASADTYPGFAGLVADTSVNVGMAAGIVLAAGALIIGVAVPAAVSAITAGAAAASAASVALGGEAIPVAFVVSAGATEAVGLVSVVAGPLAIIMIAITIGVTAGMQAFNSETTIKNLNGLFTKLTTAINTAPDLQAFANDTSGLGMHKLIATLTSQTVSDVPSRAPLPTHRSGTDWNFSIDNSVTDTLTYRGWDDQVWSARTWGGWFVGSCGGRACLQTDFISGDFRYVDWDGAKWSAARLGDLLVSTKAQVSATDKDCGLVTDGNVSGCRNYVSRNIRLKDGGGHPVVAALSPFTLPVFTDVVSLPFNPGFASTRTISATGNPAPSICLAAGTLPAGFSLNGGGCGQGSFEIRYDGSSAVQGKYPVTLTASNHIGEPVTRQLAVDFSPQLAITSPGTLTINAGFPVDFTVTATGNPTPTLSPNSLLNLSSFNLTFTDHGDGTATISGRPLTPLGIGACFHTGGVPCGIIATNSQGTVEQQLNFVVTAAPSASLVPPTSATFLAGVPNQVSIRTYGAVTPVTIVLRPSSLGVEPPAWLTFQDLGDGTAVLRGTPPLGTTSPVTVGIDVRAVGSLETTIPRTLDYQLSVAELPAFTSSNSATFTAGTSGDFDITANQGTITLAGTLPTGLTFTPGNPASISGTPAVNTGGDYTVVLVADAGASGTATQSLQLNVNAPPKITSENRATFISGSPGVYAVTTTGFPSLSTSAVPVSSPPPTDPAQGKGMYFTVAGLPAGLHVSNWNAQNFATGTLTIEGTPTGAGTYPVQITAANGVGAPAQQTLMLTVVRLTGAAPASGTTCNGNYSGTFIGNMTISAGQNCSFIGGAVKGNVAVNGGSFSITNANITGNLSIQGNAAFSIGEGSHISGSITIQNVSSAASNNRVCGALVDSNLSLSTNATAVAIGSADVVACPGNSVGGNVTVQGNTGVTTVYNNFMNKNLTCTSNASITGAGNAAKKKTDQCLPF